jgi:PadR family transcriptional regulator PadR
VFQLGSALLDACVLAVLSRGDTYGYELTQNIRGVIEVSESTLYPVLRRLQKDQMLITYDSPFNGRNRRYYQITSLGLQHLAYLRESWQQFKAAVEYLLNAPAANGDTRAATAQEGGQS